MYISAAARLEGDSYFTEEAAQIPEDVDTKASATTLSVQNSPIVRTGITFGVCPLVITSKVEALLVIRGRTLPAS